MANIDKVDLATLSDAIVKELKEWQGNVEQIMIDTCEESIKEAKKEIVREFDTIKKGKRQDGEKRYRSSFTTRKKNNLSRILWNKQYQLSHLLEDGHYVYNQYGGAYDIDPKKSKYNTTVDHTKAFGVWDKTEKHIAKYVEDTLNEKLK